MKNLRTKAIAWALVLLGSLTSQAMAAQLETLDKLFKEGDCHHFGKIVVCPQIVPDQPDLIFSEDIFKSITKAPPLTIDEMDATKKALEALPEYKSTK